MFKIGDKVVCPTQGVGIVTEIVDRDFKGESLSYYQINIVNSTMKMTIPVDRAENLNIRLLSDKENVDNCINNIESFFINYDDIKNYSVKERMEANNKRLKLGTLEDHMGVVCDLTQMRENGNLNSSERHMLNQTRKILVSEISEVEAIDKAKAEELLDNALKLH